MLPRRLKTLGYVANSTQGVSHTYQVRSQYNPSVENQKYFKIQLCRILFRAVKSQNSSTRLLLRPCL